MTPFGFSRWEPFGLDFQFARYRGRFGRSWRIRRCGDPRWRPRGPISWVPLAEEGTGLIAIESRLPPEWQNPRLRYSLSTISPLTSATKAKFQPDDGIAGS